MGDDKKAVKVAIPIDTGRGDPAAESRKRITAIIGNAYTPATEDDVIPEFFTAPDDKYKILQIVAKGGMKLILKVREENTGRIMAMAVLPNAAIKPKEALRFIHEAQITANLEHPNIVPIHDIGINSSGETFFTMKYLSGEDLAAIIDKLYMKDPLYAKKFDLRTRLEIFRKVCDAVAFAHSRGVLHLDLKPENVKVGSFGEVLLIDWGLAKVLGDQEANGKEADHRFPDFDKPLDLGADQNFPLLDRDPSTVDGVAKGTPGYMSPEQAAGKNSERSRLTDVYALGGILYSLLAFRKPIEGDDFKQVLKNTIAGSIVPPRERAPENMIPKALDAVAMKALSTNPKDRYQSVLELRMEVDAFLGGFATKAEEAGTVTHLLLLLKRHRAVGVIILVFTVFLMAVAGMWMAQRLKEFTTWGNAVDISPRTDSQLYEKWICDKGAWKLRERSLWTEAPEGKEDTENVIYYGKPIYGNMAIEFNVLTEREDDFVPSGCVGVLMFADLSTNDLYDIEIGAKGNTALCIQRGKNVLTSKFFKMNPGASYHVRAEKEDDWIRLYVNGKLQLSARDVFHLDGGCSGFRVHGGGKLISNIKIYQKNAPELVSPLKEGDAFYNRSRIHSGEIRENYLRDALDSYTKVYESHKGRDLGYKALFKRAYVYAELSKFENAANDINTLKAWQPSYEFLLFEGDMWFRAGKYKLAYDAYSELLEKYPVERAISVSNIMEKIGSPVFADASAELARDFRYLIEKYKEPDR